MSDFSRNAFPQRRCSKSHPYEQVFYQIDFQLFEKYLLIFVLVYISRIFWHGSPDMPAFDAYSSIPFESRRHGKRMGCALRSTCYAASLESSTLLTNHSKNLMSGLRSTRPSNAAGIRNSIRYPISTQKSFI